MGHHLQHGMFECGVRLKCDFFHFLRKTSEKEKCYTKNYNYHSNNMRSYSEWKTMICFSSFFFSNSRFNFRLGFIPFGWFCTSNALYLMLRCVKTWNANVKQINSQWDKKNPKSHRPKTSNGTSQHQTEPNILNLFAYSPRLCESQLIKSIHTLPGIYWFYTHSSPAIRR